MHQIRWNPLGCQHCPNKQTNKQTNKQIIKQINKQNHSFSLVQRRVVIVGPCSVCSFSCLLFSKPRSDVLRIVFCCAAKWLGGGSDEVRIMRDKKTKDTCIQNRPFFPISSPRPSSTFRAQCGP